MRHLFFVILTIVPAFSFAQKHIGFSYDTAGNRIKREVVREAFKANSRQQAAGKDGHGLSGMAGGYAVKVSADDRGDNVRIYITGLKKTDKCSLGVYTLQGIQILSQEVSKDNVTIDMHDNPSGTYLLRITINEKSTAWKIVRK